MKHREKLAIAVLLLCANVLLKYSYRDELKEISSELKKIAKCDE